MSSPTLFKEVTSEQEQSVMKEKQSENQKWFLEIKTMTLRKHFISINMLGNRMNMAKDQISVWEYRGEEILHNTEITFFSKTCFKPTFSYQTSILLTKMNSR